MGFYTRHDDLDTEGGGCTRFRHVYRNHSQISAVIKLFTTLE